MALKLFQYSTIVSRQCVWVFPLEGIYVLHRFFLNVVSVVDAVGFVSVFFV